MTTDLIASESQALAEHESVIERGLNTFVEVGTALLAIREERLYRADHSTFEDYCRERWGMGRDYADRMIAAASVVPTIVSKGLPAPANEGQARELARVPEDQRAEVWRETVERTNGKPTAAAVRETYAPPAPEPTRPPITAQQIAELREAEVRPIPPQQEESQSRRRPITDQARDAGWELRKGIERIERIAADDRFPRNKSEVAAQLRGHLINAVEVCQDLLDRLDAD